MKSFREEITLRKYAAALHEASITRNNDILIRRYLDELSTLLKENRELRDALVSPCNRRRIRKKSSILYSGTSIPIYCASVFIS